MSNAIGLPAGFSHRRNADDTFDSICKSCFRTIGTEESEPELRPHEHHHACEKVAEGRTRADTLYFIRHSLISMS